MPTRPQDKDVIITEQFYNQVSESIKLVFDLTSRIDERVKMLVERQNDLDERLDKFMELQQDMAHRLTVIETKDVGDDLKTDVEEIRRKIQILELKCETMALRANSHDNRWNQVFDWALKALFMVIGAYLLFKLGWSAPPIP
jgi:uncharacterized coiled-coil DUF342 family protein